METVAIVYGVLILFQRFFLLWFGTMIKAQKSVVDTFKSQSGGVKELQDMLLTQIKPETISNVVRLKVEEERQKTKQDIDINRKEHDDLLLAVGIIFAVYPTDHILEYIKEHFSENLRNFLDEITPIMKQAYLNQKAGATSTKTKT